MFSFILGPVFCVAAGFHPMIGSGFSAPSVNSATNISNAQTGDIVFDTTNNAFYGYNGSAWAAFSGVTTQAPKTFTFTSSGTYTPSTSPAPLYIKVTMVGGGGGTGGLAGTGSTGGSGADGVIVVEEFFQ